jgi:LuxR family maltose regulon positive regulatory protein
MSTPILATKLYIPPPRSKIVLRPRLIERLNEGLSSGCKLTVVSAPAGYGKTTLLSAWATTGVCPVAWLSLDENDNVPARFLAYLVSALQAIEPNMGAEILTLFHAPQPTKIEDLLPILLNQLDDISGPYALVLDDFHLITSAEVHRVLVFILDHQPPAMHLIISTRVDPILPTAQLRARGQLTELRQADLRFTEEEAATFLRRGMNVDIAASDVAILMDRTEGWITGLQLAALSMRNREDVSRFVADFGDSHEYIVDYFASEILDRQPDSMKTFLLKTSILEELCGSLCDTLTNQADGQQTLEQLREANLFIFPLDNERCWYRYHQLFGGLLHKQLLQEMPGIVLELHRRASRWYEEHQLVDQAFEHAHSAGDQEATGRLVDTHLYSLWAMGEFRTMSHWIDVLSEEQLLHRPELIMIKVVLLANESRLEEAHSLLESAEKILENLDKTARASERNSSEGIEQKELAHLQALACVAHAWIASLQQDSQAAVNYAPLALATLTKENPQDVPWLSYLYISLSNAYLQLSDQATATDYLSEAIALGKSNNNYHLALTAMTKKAAALWAQGHIHLAAQVCQEGLRYIEQRGLGQLPIIDSLLITWGFILCERGELDRAADYIQQGLKLSQSAHHIYVQAWAYQEMIRLLIAKGDLQAAEKYFQQSASLFEQYEIPAKFGQGTAGLRILILILQERLSEAERELQLRGISLQGEIHFPNHFLYLCLARLLLARGDFAEAEKILDRLLQVCQSTEQVPYLITVYKIRSLLCEAQGVMPLAIDSLEKALELAEPEGYIQTFLDEGKPMLRLLKEFIRRKGGSAFARNLLAAFRHSASPAPATRTDGELIEPLSERECEVLGMLAEGLSNQAIAARLYLSLSTIKFHTSNIYNKLGVKSRSEATSRARTLGLLS